MNGRSHALKQVGLCLSRAAAMVINFNLLLVWLPMCKYTLTRLACMASGASSRQRHKLRELERSPLAPTNHSTFANTFNHQSQRTSNDPHPHQVVTMPRDNDSPLKVRLLTKLKWSANRTVWRFQYCFCLAKMNYINSFLVAVDHCTSLHTICATTITLASSKFFHLFLWCSHLMALCSLHAQINVSKESYMLFCFVILASILLIASRNANNN